MPIKGKGYEILITRTETQTGKVGAVTRTRTVGTYQVFHDGKPVSGLAGATFEQKGPGDNTKNGSNLDLCVAAGRYPLWTQDGTKFKTINYKKTPKAATGPTIKPRPGIELKETGARREILIHPAQGFLWSEGCIHPSRPLGNGNGRIDYAESRKRVVAIIDDMRSFLGDRFPTKDGKPISDAWVVIDEKQ
jgi:hypothetical protein